LLAAIGAEACVALSIRVPHLLGQEPWAGVDGSSGVPYFLALLPVPAAVCAAWALVRQQRRERADAARTTRLMDTMLTASREWLWATGPDGRFTFSSPACLDLTGYEPAELLGRHFSLVIEPDDLYAAERKRTGRETADGSWSGLVTVCRRKDGSRVVVEVSGSPLRDSAGNGIGFEGTSRAMGADAVAAEEIRERVEAMLADHMLLKAFQPIRSLDTGVVIGAEALTRFLSSPGSSPDAWFAEADSVGLGVELEILALETALTAARELPGAVYVAVNASPAACLDARWGACWKGPGFRDGVSFWK
jgi:PAS domain S-box-containing protein